jgi:hypothetical protein
MLNFKQIYEGWRNKLVPPAEMRSTIQQVSKERLAICDTCVFHSKNHHTPLRPDNHCTDCGCNLEAKTACLSCACPKKKWTALMDNYDEENTLKQEAYNG